MLQRLIIRAIHQFNLKSLAMSEDAVMVSIQAAITTLESGQREVARHEFEKIWASIADHPKPLHECVLSHFMADTQDDLAEELAWDQRALTAALRCPDSEAKEHHASLSIAGLLPSLHLNLGDDYLRLGDPLSCEMHLTAGVAACKDLPDGPYADMIRAGLQRLAQRLKPVTGSVQKHPYLR